MVLLESGKTFIFVSFVGNLSNWAVDDICQIGLNPTVWVIDGEKENMIKDKSCPKIILLVKNFRNELLLAHQNSSLHKKFAC